MQNVQTAKKKLVVQKDRVQEQAEVRGFYAEADEMRPPNFVEFYNDMDAMRPPNFAH